MKVSEESWEGPSRSRGSRGQILRSSHSQARAGPRGRFRRSWLAVKLAGFELSRMGILGGEHLAIWSDLSRRGGVQLQQDYAVVLLWWINRSLSRVGRMCRMLPA